MGKTVLTEPKINVKIKLAALWTSLMFCYIYGDYFELYVPGKIIDLYNGDNILGSPFKLFIASFLLAIPALMISLSVFLKASVSRILNIVFGILFTAIMIFIGVASITPWYSFYVFLALVESMISATIVVVAWRWPKK